MTVELTNGMAEIFGAEMALRRKYAFSGTQQAIFTWHGCDITVDGQCGHSYVARESPMQSYMQLHAELESRREAARSSGMDGPHVLVVGPPGTGKSTLCRLLANYAARAGHGAALVELDAGRGDLALPGCIGAVPGLRPPPVERSTAELAPLACWVGHTAAAEHVGHYKQLVGALADAVHRRRAAQRAERAAGLIVNSCGWADSLDEARPTLGRCPR